MNDAQLMLYARYVSRALPAKVIVRSLHDDQCDLSIKRHCATSAWR